MKIGEWLKLAKKRIDALDAELILLAGLQDDLPAGVDRSYLVAHAEAEIAPKNCRELEEMLVRRASGEPLAYILGYREFYGCNFTVNSEVLVPRPETEGVVDLVLGCLNDVQGDLRILEIGTGSGCIAVTLALELAKMGFSDAGIVATDLSEEALVVARKNAQNLGAKVKFLQGDLLENVPKGAKFDILVANLPYVDENWGWLDRKSLNFEPKMALYAPKQGLGAYERLLEQLVIKKVARTAVLEIDPCQRSEIRKMVQKYGFLVVREEEFGAVLEANW